MARARKTFDVQAFKAKVNRQLERQDLSVEARKALAGLLSDVLMEANAYRGFNDIYWAREGGYEAWKATGLEDTPENFPQKRPYITGTPDGSETYRYFFY